MTAQICSIGFKSGDQAGFYKMLILFFLKYSYVNFEVCDGAPSYNKYHCFLL